MWARSILFAYLDFLLMHVWPISNLNGSNKMSFNINAAEAYAQRRGTSSRFLTEEQLDLFRTNPDGTFVFDNHETRIWNSVHPRSGERFRHCKNSYIYIVQAIEPTIERRDGRTERRTYGLFFSSADAREYMKTMGLDDGTAEIIPCMKRDFRKSFWGWDVDGR